MTGDIADDWLGMEKPKPPKVVPPATAPTQDEAAERQIFTDRLNKRKGRASTRLGGSTLTGQTSAYRLLGGTA